MIAMTHFDHFLLSTYEGEHVVLDVDANELDRFQKLADAMQFAKERQLTLRAEGIKERVEAQRNQRLAEEANALAEKIAKE